MVSLCPFFCRLFESGEEQAENSEEDKSQSVCPQPISQSYAATVALSSTPPSSATLLGTVAHNLEGPSELNKLLEQLICLIIILFFFFLFMKEMFQVFHQWVEFQKSHFSLILKGYSEDGGAQKGDVIPEHEFAAGPVCLDDENEFPPVGNWPNLHSF